MQTADEKDKEANDVLGGAFKSRRIAKLKERVIQASGGEFTGFAGDDNEVISCLKLHGDIRCLSASGIPYLYSDRQGWRISPLYLQNAEKWQCTYEPVIQRACIEASANGLEIVRIDTCVLTPIQAQSTARTMLYSRSREWKVLSVASSAAIS